jgi:hypothetical protein
MNASSFGISLLFISALPIFAAQEEPVKFATLSTVSGKIYQDVLVRKVLPDGISVQHSNGAARIDFTQLGADLQRRFGFVPEKAEAFRQEEARKEGERLDREIEERLAANIAAEEAGFKSLRKSFLESILDGGGLVELRESMEQQIEKYRAEGKTTWADLLEEDLKILQHRLANLDRVELNNKNKKLESEIADLKGKLLTAMNTAEQARDAADKANRRRVPLVVYQDRPVVVPQAVPVPVPVPVPVAQPSQPIRVTNPDYHPPVPHVHVQPQQAPNCPPASQGIPFGKPTFIDNGFRVIR